MCFSKCLALLILALHNGHIYLYTFEFLAVLGDFSVKFVIWIPTRRYDSDCEPKLADQIWSANWIIVSASLNDCMWVFDRVKIWNVVVLSLRTNVRPIKESLYIVSVNKLTKISSVNKLKFVVNIFNLA